MCVLGELFLEALGCVNWRNISPQGKRKVLSAKKSANKAKGLCVRGNTSSVLLITKTKFVKKIIKK